MKYTCVFVRERNVHDVKNYSMFIGYSGGSSFK